MMLRRGIFILLLALPLAAEPLDRIAVTIGKHVIAESDILRDLRCAAFIDDQAVDVSGAAKKKSAERLVDQYLLLEDAAVTRAPLPGAEAADALLAPIRGRYSSNTAFEAALEYAQISEAELRQHLITGLRLLRYSESRFRPDSQFTDEDLRAFYSKFAAGKPGAPDFETSRAQLQQLLTNQRASEALDKWLETARDEADIVYRDAVFS